MLKYLQQLFRIRIVRYALMGGIGIPINLAALAIFLHLLGENLYPLASAFAFEVSTTINFVLNQIFTYSDQARPQGWHWVSRALKAQLTSLSALLLSFIIALIFRYAVHVSPYLANAAGIVCAFFYNFAISKRFVFMPARAERSEHALQATNFSMNAHMPGGTSAGYVQSQWRTQDMQQFETPGMAIIANTLTPSFLSKKVTVSVVVPVMNERQNIRPLYEKIAVVLKQMGKRFEIIFVDDGSTDGTFNELQKLHYEYPNSVSIVRFRKNFGKTPALVAGFSRCRGDVVFTMDGDLQDDPEEIPNFLAKLDEDYDLVSGWKFPRLDPLNKTFPSRIFNSLVSKLTGLELHDINCGFKAYRREVIEDTNLKLYGEFHRLIPIIAHWRGYRVAEIKVRHHPRAYGVSKFGAKRFARGLIDLLTVLFLTSSLHTPLRLFGKLGVWTFLLGIFVDAFVVVRSILTNEPIHNQPLLFVGILLMIFGFQFVLIGLLGEMICHYAFKPGEEYSIKQEIKLLDTYDAHRLSFPTGVPTQQRPLYAQVWERTISPQPTEAWEQQERQIQRDGNNGNNHRTTSKNIPRRPTIQPL